VSAARGRKPQRLSPFAIGLLAIAGIAVFVYIAFSKSVPFVAEYEVRGVFSSSNQLRKGNPVRIAGVDVGKVTGIEPGPGTTQIVTMSIREEGRPIHTDATMKIRPRVFLEGGYFVELRAGSPSAPKLKRRGTIPLPQTAVPVQFHQVLSALNRPSRTSLKRVLAELATSLEGGGAEGLRRTFPPLAPALRDAAWLAEASRGTAPGDIPRLIDSSARVTGVLAARASALAESVTNYNRVAGALAANDAALGATFRELDGVLAETPPALDALDRAMPPLERFAVAIRPGVRISPPVLDRAADLLVQLDLLARSPNSPSDLVRLVIQLRPALPELPRISLLSRGLFPLAGPIVTCLRDNLAPVLNAKLDDGSLSTGQTVWQEFLHVLTGFAGSAQSFDANGYWNRYLATAGTETFSTGDVPGVGRLFGGTSEPVLGARPVWRGTNGFPPFRPDQPCANQRPPDLRAAASGGGN
jgi:phospholipid/cholesterol/gamma-HCH transport system substrate-binding protein